MVLVVATARSAQATIVALEFDNGGGLTATASFELLDGGHTLEVVLRNTSTAPFGGFNGGAGMVLASLNFDLGEHDITGGDAFLGANSHVVKNSGGVWASLASPDLNNEFGFSNSGVGNPVGPELADLMNSVTAHSAGGMAVVNFDGVAGGVGNGLDYGLVVSASTPFGNNHFVLDEMRFRLSLDGPLPDLSFLGRGAYVEFGSDAEFVPSLVPEPATLWLLAGGAGLLAGFRRRGRA